VLRALAEPEPLRADLETAANVDNTTSGEVWEYDGKRFTPIAVRIGLADNQWTELLSGSIRPGDVLVTSASLRQRSRT
jgi:hypothetical protein